MCLPCVPCMCVWEGKSKALDLAGFHLQEVPPPASGCH